MQVGVSSIKDAQHLEVHEYQSILSSGDLKRGLVRQVCSHSIFHFRCLVSSDASIHLGCLPSSHSFCMGSEFQADINMVLRRLTAAPEGATLLGFAQCVVEIVERVSGGYSFLCIRVACMRWNEFSSILKVFRLVYEYRRDVIPAQDTCPTEEPCEDF